MNPELKAKWVEALRSGRYKQTKNTLYKQGAYCCLGVLARVQNPKCIREDLVYPQDDVVPLDEQKRLANMNDGYQGVDRHNFAQIADYIEAHL